MRNYRAEGSRQYRSAHFTLESLKRSMATGDILEAPVCKCDSNMNLYINLGNGITGIIHKEDVEMPRINNEVKNAAIVSRVTRSTCFKIMALDTNDDGTITATLSRRAAQEEFVNEVVSKLKPGKVINAKVTYVAHYGAFCDIGCGIIALLPTDHFCMGRFSDPRTILHKGDRIKAVVKSNVDNKKIILSMKELLGTWMEEASKFKAGDTVAATVRSIEDYGVFIELTPNLAGLAESYPGVKPGDTVSVAIKAIIPEKMKVKLIIVDVSNADAKLNMPLKFNVPESGEVLHWVYSPDNCAKRIESFIGEGKALMPNREDNEETEYNYDTNDAIEASVSKTSEDTEDTSESDE